jgi:hypothetical protein
MDDSDLEGWKDTHDLQLDLSRKLEQRTSGVLECELANRWMTPLAFTNLVNEFVCHDGSFLGMYDTFGLHTLSA